MAAFAQASGAEADCLDLTHAVVVTPADLGARERKAVAMLLDEVEKRSRIRWAETHDAPAADSPAISIESVHGPAEGFTLRVKDGRRVVVAGNDSRGVLFGIGRLLRELRMTRDSVRLSPGLDITTSPKYPLRGHQIGYRPKVNTYDAWTPAMFEQYIRDLAVFGTNAIEMIPPRSDDQPDSPHFVMPQIDMMARVSQIADDYGIDVWIWYPAMGVDYKRPETVEFALKEWGDVLSKIPRADAICVPSGDPGGLDPKPLYQFIQSATEVLHRSHPKAQMWVSTQSFNVERLDEFLGYIKAEQPTWLTGIVFGPQNRTTLRELREAVPAQYPIRNYPDITHSVRCQFPVPDWDLAYALTENREVINPRPMDFANIFRAYSEPTIGFLTYSEGCNDDLNKMLWSALGWAPETPVVDILRDYARYFVCDAYGDAFAQGLLGLEQNWRGPLLMNKGVFATLARFQDMERNANPQVLLSWRFQQGLYRAYYDAYIARRLAYETELEQQALDILRQAPRLSAAAAVDEAERILQRAVLAPVAQDLRARVFEMAEALYQSIRMQLSVPRYKAIGVERGANLDRIDTPLNNRVWLEARFAEVRQAGDEQERLKRIFDVANWTNPGPGGFYDSLGSVMERPHLVREPDHASDPEFRQAPLIGFEYDEPTWRTAWQACAETRYDSPLRMHYDGLDPQAQYTLRVVYAGDTLEAPMRLVANGKYEIHPLLPKSEPVHPVEFDVPREATSGGALDLAWTQGPKQRGSGRGCQVAEVWLIKKTP